MKKMCILLVFLTYVYHDARFRECKYRYFKLRYNKNVIFTCETGSTGWQMETK